ADTRRVCRAATRPDWSALEGRQDLLFDHRRGPAGQDDVAEPPPIRLVQGDRALAEGLLAGGVDGTRVPGDRVEEGPGPCERVGGDLVDVAQRERRPGVVE